MSPEMTLGDGIYGSECDVWSFGVILYRLFTFQDLFPFTEEGAIFNRRKSFTRNLAVSAKTGGYAPRIEMGPKQSELKHPNYFQQGSSVTLPCFADANPTATYMWFRNDSILLKDEIRISLAGGNLTIKNLNYRVDDGIYQCVAMNKHGVNVTNPLHLKTQVVGDFIYGRQEKQRKNMIIKVTLGSTTKIKCPETSYFYPKIIYWGYKISDYAYIRMREDTRVNVLFDGSLFFGKLLQKDIDFINKRHGIYCVIYSGNEFRPSIPIFLDVIGEIANEDLSKSEKVEMEDVRIQQGKFVQFQCLLRERKSRKVSWYFNGKNIANYDDHSFETFYGGTVLQVLANTKEKSGIYSCKSYDDVNSSDIAIHKLHVHGDPEWIVKPRDQSVEKGGNIATTCLCSSPTQVTYEWKINGLPLVNSSSNLVLAERFLKVKNVTEALTIRCTATNKESTVSTNFQIHVIEQAGSSSDSYKLQVMMIMNIFCVVSVLYGEIIN